MHNVLVLILGGGRGARLFPLTKHRSEPAVPIAGKYRLIDIPVSNCINSGMARIYVLTQYMSVSLHRHIANTYKFTPFSHGFVEVLAAQQTNERADWFKGTADAVRQNLHYVAVDDGRDVLILYGDQLYRIDFQDLLATHRDTDADVTLAVMPVPAEQAPNYGIVRMDETGRITRVVEKPRPDQLHELETPRGVLERHGFAATTGMYLANMGMYFFQRETLLDLLRLHPQANDFVTEILHTSLQSHQIRGHLYQGYWKDVGSVQTYFEANLSLSADPPPFDFHDPEGVIYTRARNLPASRILKAHVDQCLISDGCLVEDGADLQRCVIGVRSHIGNGARLRNVIMMGANYFQSEVLSQQPDTSQRPPVGVGEGSVLERVILDKNVRIGRNVKLINRAGQQHADGDNWYIREGIVIIPNSGVIADGTVI